MTGHRRPQPDGPRPGTTPGSVARRRQPETGSSTPRSLRGDVPGHGAHAGSSQPEPRPAARPRRAPRSGAFILGLVGPTGSGKSTVAQALDADGARVLDADRIGHDVTDHDVEVRTALVQEYGADVYTADGHLDRRMVAAKVFADPAALTRLNLLVHPRILRRLRESLAEAEREGFTGLIVVDAALLLDWGFERECDAVLAVVAPPEVQRARLMAARGWTREQADRRLARARSNEAFTALADETIVNDRRPDDATVAARAAIARLRARRTQALTGSDGADA